MKRLLIVFTIFILACLGLYLKLDIPSYLKSKKRAELYKLSEHEDFKDITQLIADDKNLNDSIRMPFVKGERRLIVFKYKSGDQFVAGTVNYIVDGEHPTMVFLRGGNGFYGIMRPNNPFTLFKNYNVVQTLYRGNIYGGEDEIGGNDILDVESLFNFFPQIEKNIQKRVSAPITMVGVSRGSMQMFASIARSKIVRDAVEKAVSISGAVDFELGYKNRIDLRLLYRFKYLKSKNKIFQDWLDLRNPVKLAKKIPSNLKVLIAHGQLDKRVSESQPMNLKKKLDKLNIHSKIIIYPNGRHGLFNQLDDIAKKIDEL